MEPALAGPRLFAVWRCSRGDFQKVFCKVYCSPGFERCYSYLVPVAFFCDP